VLPGAVILVILGALYMGGAFSPSLTLLMRSLSAAVVGLVAVTTLRIVRGSLRGGRALVVAALTFAAVGPLRLPTVGVVLVMAAASLWLQRAPRAAGAPLERADGC
jgi:chromate transport protein ChrA